MILALSACGAPITNLQSVLAPKTIKRSADAGPGANPISTGRATQVFSDLCVRQAPNFTGTEGLAAKNGFVQNTQFGTYYHPQENMSVKLIGGDCSMVFASNDDTGALEQSLLASAPMAQFRPGTSLGNDHFYNVRLGFN